MWVKNKLMFFFFPLVMVLRGGVTDFIQQAARGRGGGWGFKEHVGLRVSSVSNSRATGSSEQPILPGHLHKLPLGHSDPVQGI